MLLTLKISGLIGCCLIIFIVVFELLFYNKKFLFSEPFCVSGEIGEIW